MEKTQQLINQLCSWIWGYPVLILMLGGGMYLTIRLKFIQLNPIRILKGTIISLKKTKSSGENNGLSQFQGFSTALAATVGTGSIVGVGSAIFLGGAGAVFWMWISALTGMALAYSENLLGAKYCGITGQNGAMAYIEKGLGCKPLAVLFSLFCTLASLGMGNMAQSNSIASACFESFGIPCFISGGICLLAVIIISRKDNIIGKVTQAIVPAMSVFYIIGCIICIAHNCEKIFPAFEQIFTSAFSVKSCVGGVVGSTIKQACITGLRRGAFSNEAGLGSTVSIHSACNIKDPCTQGMWAILEIFFDTMIICTITAICILTSGVEIGENANETLCLAFSQVLGKAGGIFMGASISLFAFATIIGWFFIGEKSWHYIFPKDKVIYRTVFCLLVYVGSVSGLSIVWGLSDIFNGLMAIPNIVAVLLLSNEVVMQTKKTFK